MSTIKTVLCPVDFSMESRSAIRYAKEFATGMDARIVLLHVVDTPEEDQALAVAVAHEEEPEACPNTRLELIVREFEEQGYSVNKAIEMGHPAELILKKALEVDASLIIMGTVGRSGLKRFIQGSISEMVTRKADCPVLIVKR